MPALDSNLRTYAAMWAPLYEAVLDLLGTTGTVLPIGDYRSGQPNATTFTTRGDQQVTFTWSEAPGSFDTALDLTALSSFQGIIPIVEFNGTDEEADTPDIAYFTRDDSASEKMSMGAWVHITNTATTRMILSKRDDTTSSEAREWYFGIDSNEKPQLVLTDESVAKFPNRTTDTGISTGVWRHVVITYDGTGGATAANGITIYVDGAVEASTATNDASYVAMEDTASLVRLAFLQGSSAGDNFFVGKMAGGPLGPFFTQVELTADQVKRLYQLGQAAMGL